MQWTYKSLETPQTLSELKKILLMNRGIHNKSAEVEFFTPRDPLELTLSEVGLDPEQMQQVLARLRRALTHHEDVLVFGDYDADGVCATAILWQALKAFGIIARPFIPHREKHGYGLSERSLAAVLADQKPDLLITVDNGIVAHAACQQLQQLGIDTIITDHHQLEVAPDTGQPAYPPALAILHSTQLCGSTVAWFLARELNPNSPELARNALDLAAIATVTDQMQLLGVNRSFVKHGLLAIQKSQRVGLQLLLAKAGIEQKAVGVGNINFGIGPRINAMGRLKSGMDALRLLCTKSLERAEELVNELNDTNLTRQELTNDMIAHALERADSWKDESIIIIESSEYHEGVIGLIAGKLMETYYKPAIVIAVNGTAAKASARSIPGVNIIEMVRLVRDDLLEAGGHPMAAGFSLLPDKIEVVRQRLQVLAKTHIAAVQLEPTLELDCVLEPHLLTAECWEMIEEFAPFGQGNREPVFGLLGNQVVSAGKMGSDGKHLRLNIKLNTSKGEILSCVGWRLGELADQLKMHQQVDVAGVLELREWRGEQNLQLVVKDVVPAAPSSR